MTGLGRFSLLAELLLIAQVTRVNELSAFLCSGYVLRKSTLYLVALVFGARQRVYQIGALLFYFWLPNAMEAPTPVSAYFHSAIMVKAGVYRVMRLSSVMGDTAAWETVLPLFGGFTLAISRCWSMQTD